MEKNDMPSIRKHYLKSSAAYGIILASTTCISCYMGSKYACAAAGIFCGIGIADLLICLVIMPAFIAWDRKQLKKSLENGRSLSERAVQYLSHPGAEERRPFLLVQSLLFFLPAVIYYSMAGTWSR
jgi:hypothetical protein